MSDRRSEGGIAKPRAVEQFEIAYLAATVIGAIGSRVNSAAVVTQFQLAGRPLPSEYGRHMLAIFLLAGIAAALGIWWLVIHRHSRAARWASLLVAAFMAVSSTVSLAARHVGGLDVRFPALGKAAALTATVLFLIAAARLFAAGAAPWFARAPAR